VTRGKSHSLKLVNAKQLLAALPESFGVSSIEFAFVLPAKSDPTRFKLTKVDTDELGDFATKVKKNRKEKGEGGEG
jgi:hypothetical protein